jgi:hypothetical protein
MWSIAASMYIHDEHMETIFRQRVEPGTAIFIRAKSRNWLGAHLFVEEPIGSEGGDDDECEESGSFVMRNIKTIWPWARVDKEQGRIGSRTTGSGSGSGSGSGGRGSGSGSGSGGGGSGGSGSGSGSGGGGSGSGTASGNGAGGDGAGDEETTEASGEGVVVVPLTAEALASLERPGWAAAAAANAAIAAAKEHELGEGAVVQCSICQEDKNTNDCKQYDCGHCNCCECFDKVSLSLGKVCVRVCVCVGVWVGVSSIDTKKKITISCLFACILAVGGDRGRQNEMSCVQWRR